MSNVYENKCLICASYTDENGMDECKKFACGGSSGIATRLEGCPCFVFGFETEGYDVRVYQDSVIKQYCVDDANRLNALLQHFKEVGIDVGDVKVTERLSLK